MSRTLIRGGYVISMDPDLGDIDGGDVLIEDDRILAVGKYVPASDAQVIDATGQIVAPGLIDTHKHTWQTLLRGLGYDTSTIAYLARVRFGLSRAYSPADISLGNRLGALEALNSGVTTILDFSHSINTPEHADAAIEGLDQAGVRAIFGYGFFESSPNAPAYFSGPEERIKDFHRIAATYFSSDRGLLSLGVSLNEQGMVPFEYTRAEIEAARAHNALIVTHTLGLPGRSSGVAELAEAGLLGPDQVHVHCNGLPEQDWVELARAGAKLSISPEPELNADLGAPPFTQCERHGVKPTISCDSLYSTPGDLLTQVRIGLGFKRWLDVEANTLAPREPAKPKTTAYEALGWCTVNAADAVGLADHIGSLTPGKQADLIMVGGSSFSLHPQLHPAGTVVYGTSPSEIRTVMVNGKLVKHNGALIDHDMTALALQADRAAEQIIERGAKLPSGLPREIEEALGVA